MVFLTFLVGGSNAWISLCSSDPGTEKDRVMGQNLNGLAPRAGRRIMCKEEKGRIEMIFLFLILLAEFILNLIFFILSIYVLAEFTILFTILSG
jgi:hypothetical protein